jgi:hypothetical protein
MAKQVTQILTRSRDTLMYDLAGVATLALMTVGLLHLPGLV